LIALLISYFEKYLEFQLDFGIDEIFDKAGKDQCLKINFV